jgi:hypothetical protein
MDWTLELDFSKITIDLTENKLERNQINNNTKIVSWGYASEISNCKTELLNCVQVSPFNQVKSL